MLNHLSKRHFFHLEKREKEFEDDEKIATFVDKLCIRRRKQNGVCQKLRFFLRENNDGKVIIYEILSGDEKKC